MNSESVFVVNLILLYFIYVLFKVMYCNMVKQADERYIKVLIHCSSKTEVNIQVDVTQVWGSIDKINGERDQTLLM